MHLSGLFIYPVKSLRGTAVSTAQLDERGLIGDRRFMVVDANLKFLTQRALPRMALLETKLSANQLILHNPHHGSAAVGLTDDGPSLQVQVWRDTVEAIDCGVEISDWISDFLHHPCRLVRIGSTYRRPVNPDRAQPGDEVSFADGYPLLAIGEASLADLNDRISENGDEPVPMDRFRPNLVIANSAPFSEDTWARFNIGHAVFRTAGPCARCIITTTDQHTAQRGHEPLRTLATYRRDPDQPANLNFGMNLIHETKSGPLQIGDTVTLARTDSSPA